MSLHYVKNIKPDNINFKEKERQLKHTFKAKHFTKKFQILRVNRGENVHNYSV